MGAVNLQDVAHVSGFAYGPCRSCGTYHTGRLESVDELDRDLSVRRLCRVAGPCGRRKARSTRATITVHETEVQTQVLM